MTAKSLGKKIRMARDKAEMSQFDLSTLIGVREGVISRWEHDKHVPTMKYLSLLSKHLKISLDDLVSA